MDLKQAAGQAQQARKGSAPTVEEAF